MATASVFLGVEAAEHGLFSGWMVKALVPTSPIALGPSGARGGLERPPLPGACLGLAAPGVAVGDRLQGRLAVGMSGQLPLCLWSCQNLALTVGQEAAGHGAVEGGEGWPGL